MRKSIQLSMVQLITVIFGVGLSYASSPEAIRSACQGKTGSELNQCVKDLAALEGSRACGGLVQGSLANPNTCVASINFQPNIDLIMRPGQKYDVRQNSNSNKGEVFSVAAEQTSEAPAMLSSAASNAE